MNAVVALSALSPVGRRRWVTTLAGVTVLHAGVFGVLAWHHEAVAPSLLAEPAVVMLELPAGAESQRSAKRPDALASPGPVIKERMEPGSRAVQTAARAIPHVSPPRPEPQVPSHATDVSPSHTPAPMPSAPMPAAGIMAAEPQQMADSPSIGTRPQSIADVAQPSGWHDSAGEDAATPGAASPSNVSQSLPGASQSGQGSASGQAGESARVHWYAAILARLERFKRYPPSARRSRTQGVALVHYVVNRTGRVVDAQLLRGSGSPELDSEAVAAVMRASPLPPPPAEVAGDQVEVTTPIRFVLR